MSDSNQTLRTALETSDMLVIDGLHAWDFFLGNALTLESMDGRERKVWRFELEQVNAATFDEAGQHWIIRSDTAEHTLVCLDAFTPADDESEDDLEEV